MALNVFCVAFMLILVFEPTLASKIVLWLFQKLEKFHILKKKEERLEKLQNSMIEYHKAAAIIQGHRIFIFSDVRCHIDSETDPFFNYISCIQSNGTFCIRIY